MIRNFIVVLVAVCAMSAVATATDLHKLWDDRCGDCHGHSADFAREFLSVADDKLYGQHSDRDLHLFLSDHYLVGSDQVDAVYAMLFAQASSQAQFKAKCGACHQQAAQLARQSLVLRDGELYARNSGRLIREFMQRHGGLEVDEVAFFVQLLTRLEQETRQP